MTFTGCSPSLSDDNEVEEGELSAESKGLCVGLAEDDDVAVVESNVMFRLKAVCCCGNAVVDMLPM